MIAALFASNKGVNVELRSPFSIISIPVSLGKNFCCKIFAAASEISSIALKILSITCGNYMI